MCVRVLWFVGENMGITPFRSLSQFNKCVVFRQTWSQPQPSHVPTHNLWKQPQGRRHIHGSLPLYYYNCLSFSYWVFLGLVLHCFGLSFISLPVFLSLRTKVCFQVGRGRTMTRNIFPCSTARVPTMPYGSSVNLLPARSGITSCSLSLSSGQPEAAIRSTLI